MELGLGRGTQRPGTGLFHLDEALLCERLLICLLCLFFFGGGVFWVGEGYEMRGRMGKRAGRARANERLIFYYFRKRFVWI